MEEILASIRRIIAEDGDQPPPPSRSQAVPNSSSDEILELTEVVEEDGTVRAPAFVDPAYPEPMPDPPAAPMRAAAPMQPPAIGERLVSEAAAAASIAAFSQLNQLGESSEPPMSDVHLGDGEKTIEGMVRDMLRPLLKEWLDASLPRLVERIVREEVDRMVRDVRSR